MIKSGVFHKNKCISKLIFSSEWSLFQKYLGRIDAFWQSVVVLAISLWWIINLQVTAPNPAEIFYEHCKNDQGVLIKSI